MRRSFNKKCRPKKLENNHANWMTIYGNSIPIKWFLHFILINNKKPNHFEQQFENSFPVWKCGSVLTSVGAPRQLLNISHWQVINHKTSLSSLMSSNKAFQVICGRTDWQTSSVVFVLYSLCFRIIFHNYLLWW